MRLKYFVGKTIHNMLDYMNKWNYKSVAFIPSGRIVTLDLKRISFDPKNIFDVGANVGQTANNFARHFPNATIYSFEPVLSVHEELVANTSNPRIKCFNQALGDKKSQTKIYKSKSYNWLASINGVSNDELTDEEIIDVTTGVDVCAEHQIAVVDILKIDTEGYEINVLDGFKPMLKNQVKFIYIETSFDRDTKCQTYITDLLEYLHPYGFIVSGFYNQHRASNSKLRLNHCDMLLTNAGLTGI